MEIETMNPRITIEIRKGLVTVLTNKLRWREPNGLKSKPVIDIVIHDYDIEGGSYNEGVIKRGYSRDITKVAVRY
jgi:hypothetical protein